MCNNGIQRQESSLPGCFDGFADYIARGLDFSWIARLVNRILSYFWGSYRERTAEFQEKRTFVVKSERSEMERVTIKDQTKKKIVKIKEGHLYLGVGIKKIRVLFELKVKAKPLFGDDINGKHLFIRESKEKGVYAIQRKNSEGQVVDSWVVDTTKALKICELEKIATYVPIETVYFCSSLLNSADEYDHTPKDYCYDSVAIEGCTRFLIHP